MRQSLLVISISACLLSCLCLAEDSPSEWIRTPLGCVRSDGGAALRAEIRQPAPGRPQKIFLEVVTADAKIVQTFAEGLPTSASFKQPLISPDGKSVIYSERAPAVPGGSFRSKLVTQTSFKQESGKAAKFTGGSMHQEPYAEHFLRVNGGGSGPETLGGVGDYLQASFSLDGRRIVSALYHESKWHLSVLELGSVEAQVFMHSSTSGAPNEFVYMTPCFQKDGKAIWFSTKDGRSRYAIARVEPGQNKAQLVLKSPDLNFMAPAPSPDGSQLAYIASRNDTHGELWVAAADGATPRCLLKPKAGERVDFVQFSQDGQRLFFTTLITGPAQAAPRGVIAPAAARYFRFSAIGVSGGEATVLVEDLEKAFSKK